MLRTSVAMHFEKNTCFEKNLQTVWNKYLVFGLMV